MSLPVAFSKLTALKQNLPDGIRVEEKYVDEFDAILDALEKESGGDLSSFRIATAEVKPRAVSARPRSYSGRIPMQVNYSSEKYCERASSKTKIGFEPPQV